MIYGTLQNTPSLNRSSQPTDCTEQVIISLNKINLIPKQKAPKIKLRLINDATISSFQKLLKEETWNQIYDTSGINETFNVFQDFF